MAKDSKKKQAERRSRRANNQQTMRVLLNNLQLRDENGRLRHAIERAQRQNFQSTLTLLAVLGQAGGTLRFTKGTMDQVKGNLSKYDYDIQPVEGDAETFTVTVVEAAAGVPTQGTTVDAVDTIDVEPEPSGPETVVGDQPVTETVIEA